MANFGGSTGLFSGFDTSFLSGLLNFSINLLALIVVIALILAAVMYIKKPYYHSWIYACLIRSSATTKVVVIKLTFGGLEYE